VVSPNDIEKKSLEMHIALQDAREQAVNLRLENLQDSIDNNQSTVDQMRQEFITKLDNIRVLYDSQISDIWDAIQETRDSRTTQIINWGAAIIATLIGAIGIVIIKIVFPMMQK